MIDCSHGNSQKDYRKQMEVIDSLVHQINHASKAIFGVMLESYLVEGRQDFSVNKPLTYGQSITDACLSFSETKNALEKLAQAVKERRKMQGKIR